MEDRNGHVINKGSGFGGRILSSPRDVHENFEEEDIWDIGVKDITSNPYGDSSTTMKNLSGSSSRTFSSVSSYTPRNIPRRATTNHEAIVGQVLQKSSAPMKIPDWSKIYGKRSNAIINNCYGDYHGCDDHDRDRDFDFDDDDDDGDDGDGIVPPHEWIARKLARSQISSFSVCEGIGRTLKGRDLSKVRNAILTKTGFLE